MDEPDQRDAVRQPLAAAARASASICVTAAISLLFSLGWNALYSSVSDHISSAQSGLLLLVWVLGWPLCAMALALGFLNRSRARAGAYVALCLAFAMGTAVGLALTGMLEPVVHPQQTMLLFVWSFGISLVIGVIGMGLVFGPAQLRRWRRHTQGNCPVCGELLDAPGATCKVCRERDADHAVRFSWLLTPLPVIACVLTVVITWRGIAAGRDYMQEVARFESLGADGSHRLATTDRSHNLIEHPTPFFPFEGTTIRGCFLIRFDESSRETEAGSMAVAELMPFMGTEIPRGLDPPVLVMLTRSQIDDFWANGIPEHVLAAIDEYSLGIDTGNRWLTDLDVMPPNQKAHRLEVDERGVLEFIPALR